MTVILLEEQTDQKNVTGFDYKRVWPHRSGGEHSSQEQAEWSQHFRWKIAFRGRPQCPSGGETNRIPMSNGTVRRGFPFSEGDPIPSFE